MDSVTRSRFGRGAVFWGAGLLLIAVGLTAYASGQALLLVFAAILWSVLLRGLAGVLRRRLPVGEGLSVLAALLLLFGTLGVGVHLTLPSLRKQAAQMAEEMPKAVALVRSEIDSRPVLKRFVGEPLKALTRPEFVGRSLGLFATFLGGIAAVLFVLVMGAYLAAQPALYRRGVALLVAPGSRPRAYRLMDALGETMGNWLTAKLLEMGVVLVLTWAGLAALGVPMALALAVIAALLEFIPNIGPISSVVPAVLVTLGSEPDKAMQVVGLYIAVQFVQTEIVTPVIERRLVRIPPALLFSGQVLMGVWAGGLGVLLAAPMTACAMVVVSELYVDELEEAADQGQLAQAGPPARVSTRAGRRRAGRAGARGP